MNFTRRTQKTVFSSILLFGSPLVYSAGCNICNNISRIFRFACNHGNSAGLLGFRIKITNCFSTENESSDSQEKASLIVSDTEKSQMGTGVLEDLLTDTQGKPQQNNELDQTRQAATPANTNIRAEQHRRRFTGYGRGYESRHPQQRPSEQSRVDGEAAASRPETTTRPDRVDRPERPDRPERVERPDRPGR